MIPYPQNRYLMTKYRYLENKYMSNILNLDSKSKQWQRASRALSRLKKTESYKLVIEFDNTY
jgi:hypothetical protein